MMTLTNVINVYISEFIEYYFSAKFGKFVFFSCLIILTRVTNHPIVQENYANFDSSKAKESTCEGLE